jgi:Sulfatase
MENQPQRRQCHGHTEAHASRMGVLQVPLGLHHALPTLVEEVRGFGLGRGDQEPAYHDQQQTEYAEERAQLTPRARRSVSRRKSHAFRRHLGPFGRRRGIPRPDHRLVLAKLKENLVERAALARSLALVLIAATVMSACAPGDPRPTAVQLRQAVSGSDLWVVLIDAAAAEHFSFYGYERETTPVLAKLAHESIVFEMAYSQASATPLSVFSLMTSRYPHMSGPTPAQPELAAMIGPQLPTLASRLAPLFSARGAILANQ